MSRITSLFIPFRFIRCAKTRSQIDFVTGGDNAIAWRELFPFDADRLTAACGDDNEVEAAEIMLNTAVKKAAITSPRIAMEIAVKWNMLRVTLMR